MGVRIFVIVPFMFLVWSVWPLVAAQAQGQSANAGLKKFQGAWILVSGEMDGRKVADEHVKQSRITYVGKKIEVINPHQHKDTIVATVIKLDTKKNPKEMQWVRSSGPNAGATMTGIYEFEGPDKYKICFDPAGSAAPGKFAADKGSGLVFQTWKREKK
jgi:uncharacterized protein (TIGR03067 family)